MAAQVVYENAPATTAAMTSGTLFSGKVFWMSRRTPFRSTYVERIKSNGGTLTDVENSADYKIADHIRMKFASPGSVSYEFVDACLKAGALVDPTPHLIFPEGHEPRSIGSIQRPAKGVRAPFTAEDDRILVQWVNERAQGQIAVRGNVIYHELEDKYPHHTWQSWRSRYVKNLMPRQPALAAPTASTNLQARPHADQEATARSEPAATRMQKQAAEGSNVPIAENKDNKDPNLEQSEQGVSQGVDSTMAVNGQSEREDSETLRVEAPYPPITQADVEESEEDVDVEVKKEPVIDGNNGSGEKAADVDDGSSPVNVQGVTINGSDNGNDLQSIASFVAEDFDTLLDASKSILSMEPSRVEEAWALFAEEDDLGRTGAQWRTYWETEVRPVYLQLKQQRQIEGAPSSDVEPDGTNSEEESEGEESKARSSSGSAPTTPKAAEADGIEILADDGKRHLSTPLRPKSSTSDKREREDESDESGSTQVIGERSPLKKRRLDADNAEPDATSVVQDSEAEDPYTQAPGFATASTVKIESQGGNTVDLSQMSDGHSESSESSAAFEDSTLYETAPPQPISRDAEVESSEDDGAEYVNTQGHIDAQLMSEIGSAAQHTSPPRRSQRSQRPSSSQPAPSSQPPTAPPPATFDGENSDANSDSDSDLSEVVVMRRAPDSSFAPAAFQNSSPPPSSSRLLPPQHQQQQQQQRQQQNQARPALLPAFSSSIKGRGKQRQHRPSESPPPSTPPRTKRKEADSRPVSTSSTKHPRSTPPLSLIPTDIPAWVRAHTARGVSMARLQRAVKAASGELEVAERVLRALSENDGTMPPHERGIWTDTDDARLKRGAESDLIPLVKKHGKKLLEERREFLVAFEGSDDDE